MKIFPSVGFLALVGIAVAASLYGSARQGAGAGAPVALAPASMKSAGTVGERYQSFNVEMLEVTGGNFWRPYGSTEQAPAPSRARTGDTPAGMDPTLYQYRPPIDLSSARLRRLAGALGPAYVRVSGTWANTTYFAGPDETLSTPPEGFSGVLTRQQWKGVVDFSRAVDAEIVTSFAISAGTRDAAGLWSPQQARSVLDYTKAIGGRIAAAEFMNEPTFAAMGGAPKGYDAAMYGRDFKVFRAFVKQSAPDVLILGPGSVGETSGSWGFAGTRLSVVKTRDILAAAGRGVDAFSYHHYGAVSQRCASRGAPAGMQTTPDAALSEEWLRRTDETLAFYRPLRDEFEPGKPIWLTETADAACGGNPWARTFLDSFRYLDQLGRLAKQQVQVVAHNTLVASDYGLVDDRDLTPKPNYWAALLWRRLMGATVLDSGIPIQAGLHVYAHCLRSTPGGVAVIAINTDRTAPRTLTVPLAGERYTLSSSSKDLQDTRVRLNDVELKLARNDELPALSAVRTSPGDVVLPPATITFLALRQAANAACR